MRPVTIARRPLLAGLAGAAATAALPARAAGPLTLMTDWSPYGAHAPLFLAAQKGWFKDAGLDVRILDGKGSITTTQLVAASTADIGFVQLAGMAAAISQGMKLTSIAGYIRAGDNGLIVPQDSPIKAPPDLIGKRIVYPLGGGSASLMEAFFTTVGLPRNQLQLIGVDSSALASTYVAGGVDAAISTIAYLVPMIEDKRASRTIPYSQYGLRVPSFGLAVRSADVASRGPELAKLVAAVNRAWTTIIGGGEQEAIDAIVAQRPNDRLDKTVMLNQLRQYLKLMDTPATQGKPIGWQADSDWTEALAAMSKAGMLKGSVTPANCYTNQFIPTA